MASTTLAEISRQDLPGQSTAPVASITDVKHLSSYNWIEAPTPTIAVPGSPPLWSAPGVPQQLKKDSGLVYIAQNAARHPDSPLEPLFRSLYVTDPSFDIRSIDVVTDRNNVRKLLSFINPSSTKTRLEQFTINIEITKNTALFSRTETTTSEFIQPHELRGYGHEFEKAYTTSQIDGSTGHHRIISYRFSDLNFIIRHETDGYVDASRGTSSSGSKAFKSENDFDLLGSDGGAPSSSSEVLKSDNLFETMGSDRGTPSSSSKALETDSLSATLGSLSLSRTSRTPVATPTGPKLAVEKAGQFIPLESTLEIKTRVSNRPLDISEVAPQLWISQTPKLVRAYHRKGKFKRPQVEDVTARIKEWEENNQADLRKLASLIGKIIDVVKGHGGKAIVRYEVCEDIITVSKVDGKKMLPEDLYFKWDHDENSGTEIR